MTVLILGFYLGLLVFALNGLQWMALINKQRELKVTEERIVRLLMRSKLRR